jgi:hypothetical protein
VVFGEIAIEDVRNLLGAAKLTTVSPLVGCATSLPAGQPNVQLIGKVAGANSLEIIILGCRIHRYPLPADEHYQIIAVEHQLSIVDMPEDQQGQHNVVIALKAVKKE